MPPKGAGVTRTRLQELQEELAFLVSNPKPVDEIDVKVTAVKDEIEQLFNRFDSKGRQGNDGKVTPKPALTAVPRRQSNVSSQACRDSLSQVFRRKSAFQALSAHRRATFTLKDHFLSQLPLPHAPPEYWVLTEALAHYESSRSGKRALTDRDREVAVQDRQHSDGFEMLYRDVMRDCVKARNGRRKGGVSPGVSPVSDRRGSLHERKLLDKATREILDGFELLHGSSRDKRKHGTEKNLLRNPVAIPLPDYIVAQLQALRSSASRGLFYHRVFEWHAKGLEEAKAKRVAETIASHIGNFNYITLNKRAVHESGPEKIFRTRMDRKEQLERRDETAVEGLLGWVATTLELQRYHELARKMGNAKEPISEMLAKNWSTHTALVTRTMPLVTALCESRDERYEERMEEGRRRAKQAQQISIQDKSRYWNIVLRALRVYVRRQREKRYAAPASLLQQFFRHFTHVTLISRNVAKYRRKIILVQRQIQRYFVMREARRCILSLEWIVVECEMLQIERPLRRALTGYRGHERDEVVFMPQGGCSTEARFPIICSHVLSLTRMRAQERLQYHRLMEFYRTERSKYDARHDERSGMPPPMPPSAPLYHLLMSREVLRIIIVGEHNAMKARKSSEKTSVLSGGPYSPRALQQFPALPLPRGVESKGVAAHRETTSPGTSQSLRVFAHRNTAEPAREVSATEKALRRVSMQVPETMTMQEEASSERRTRETTAPRAAVPRCIVRSDKEYAEILQLPSVTEMRRFLKPTQPAGLVDEVSRGRQRDASEAVGIQSGAGGPHVLHPHAPRSAKRRHQRMQLSLANLRTAAIQKEELSPVVSHCKTARDERQRDEQRVVASDGPRSAWLPALHRPPLRGAMRSSMPVRSLAVPLPTVGAGQFVTARPFVFEMPTAEAAQLRLEESFPGVASLLHQSAA